MEIKIKARKWGNSIALILPKVLVEANKVRENDELTVEIKMRPLAGDFFGKFPRNSRKTAQKVKNEMRKGWN